jgi:SAM-dependent methyltransferase
MMHDASSPELGERDFVTNYDRFVGELRALIDAMSDADRRSLSAHNAGWLTADLEESKRRYVNAFRLLRPHLRPSAHILDVGGFFAAFPLTLRALGYRVSLAEKFEYYGSALAGVVRLASANGVEVRDKDFCMEPIAPGGTYDIVSCMAVAEHLADSPRLLMENIRGAMTEEGRLLFEVPNMVSWVNRWNLFRGRNFMPSIEVIYDSASPFTGHHHEYTPQDVRALMSRSELAIERLEYFNCYYDGISGVRGWLEWRLVPALFPASRDSIMALCRKL